MSARIFFLIMVCAGLAACGAPETLRDFGNSGQGPEEFAVVPGRPLETPPNFAELPAPTPGGANRTDISPLADAVATLGGNPARLDQTGVPSSDSALVSYVSRNGVPVGIRETLLAEDEDFRRRRGRFTQIRIVRNDRYNLVYSPYALDANAEMLRFRRAGARTPSAPPG